MQLGRIGGVGICGLLLSGGIAWPVAAQNGGAGSDAAPMQLADRGDDHRPAFFSVAPNGARVDVRNASAFRRRVSLTLIDVPLGDAVHAIARQAGLDLTYSTELIPVGARVSLRADDITVVAALTDVLVDAGLDVELTGSTRLALVRRWAPVSAERRPQGTGTITGHVTDGALKAPLSQVTVRIDGTSAAASADADGRYVLAGVAPGTYHVTARRVGYQPATKDVTISGTERATLDFALVAAPTRLDEVVTTAVGQQRRYEVGNTISTINADSITPTAPITSLTDLISARAPGVEVVETSGMTGSGESIRIRGLSSLVLQNDPILIVDGVRQDNSAGGDLGAAFFSLGIFNQNPTPSRLNDIDFADVATIDILKGPAASTEYGTDAANGVVVITTKHGTAGPPQWRASAEQTASDIPTSYPDGYYAWGHLTDGTNTGVDCPLYPVFGTPASTTGTCTVDSVTRWSPFNHAATTLYGTGNRGKYDLSVSGGSDAVRYFVAGGLTNETGIVRLPPVFRDFADSASIDLPNAVFQPNSEQQRSMRVNTAIKLGATADLTATGSYLSTYQETPESGSLFRGTQNGIEIGDAAHFYGYDGYGGSTGNPITQFSELGSQNTQRLTGGLTGSWRPTGWFVGHASAGLDHGSQQEREINYPLPDDIANLPAIGLIDATTDIYSVDMRGTATVALTHAIRSVTSAGLQMVDTRVAGQGASAQHITSTNLTLNGATGAAVTQQGTRQATLGGYGEEQLSFADRLFITGALRIDAASGFGYAYSTAAYPKASVSWLALDQRGMTLRVRGAFGESGVQPTNGAALQLFAPVSVPGPGGAVVSGSQLNWPGNPNLQPERSAEFEGGFDVGAWGNRVSLEVTGYSKTTRDALVNTSAGLELGNYTYQENIGEVRNTGVEGTATIGVIATPRVTWDVVVNGSVNHNTLLSLAPGVISQSVFAGSATVRQEVGRPLYGIWGTMITYADANHDGIIEPGELVASDSVEYFGPSLPTQEVSVSTHLGLWRGAVSLSGLVDYRGGYKIVNQQSYYGDGAVNTQGSNIPTAPLRLQARALETTSTFGFSQFDAEDGTFVRVREIAVTYAVPRSALRAVRLQGLSLTLAVRNLALWTRYSGPDPETSVNQYNVVSSPGTGGYGINNDIRVDGGAVPLARYWVARLNLGL